MRTLRIPAWVGFFLAVATPLGAQEKYADPDAPSAHAAARRALPGVVRKIEGKVVGIVGIERGFSGTSRGIEAVLEDLGAEITAQEIRIDLSADVLFDFDEAEIKPAAAEELGKVVQVIRVHPGAPIMVEGHTDGQGEEGYNMRLSQRRAVAVKAWLVANGGVSPNKVSTRGWGAANPIAPNTRPDGGDDPEGRRRNRRVEITVRTGAS